MPEPRLHDLHVGAGRDQFVLGRNDLWCWQSALLEFSYFERQGPALVDLALFGYFATRLSKPAGLAAIRHT